LDKKYLSKKNIIKQSIGIVLGVLFLYLALKNSNLSIVKEKLKTVHILSLFFASTFLLIQYVVRSLRWQFIGSPIKKFGFINSLLAVNIGFFINLILPFRLGEFAKVWVSVKREKISFSNGVGLLVIERGMDLLSLLIIFLCILPFAPIPDNIRNPLLIFFILMILVFLILIFSARKDFLFKIKKIFPENILFNQLFDKYDKFINGIEILGSNVNLLKLILFSLFIWVWGIFFYYLIVSGMGFQLNWSAYIILPVIVGLGISLPGMPGFIGTYEYFVILVLGLYGVDHNSALAVAIVLHGWQYLLVLTVGGISYFYEKNFFS